MAVPSARIRLFERQAAVLASEVPELLIGGDEEGQVGLSHALRVVAILECSQRPGLRVQLVQWNDADLRRTHLEGGKSIRALLAGLESHGGVTITGQGARFRNGSILRWSGCSREGQLDRLLTQPIDVLLVDDGHEMPGAIYQRLRDQAQASVHPNRRVVVAAKQIRTGWVADHWGNGHPDRDVLSIERSDIDETLIQSQIRQSYPDFMRELHGATWVESPPTVAMVDAVDRWITGDEFDHLAIHVPSQHGKTTIGPISAIPYILTQVAPSAWCSVSSYDQDKANEVNGEARANFLRAGGELSFGLKRVKRWGTVARGGSWAAGTGGGNIGRPASFSFVDDGDSGWEDAVNPTKQKRKRNFYRSKLRSRESMFAAGGIEQKILATATRWDPEDLVGFMEQLGHDAGERWAILVLSALYDPKVLEEYREMYPDFMILDDWRTEPGEPIWPERRSAEKWAQTQIIRGPIIFDTECQQKAKGVQHGGLFEADYFGRLERDPAFAAAQPNEDVYSEQVRAWDLAATEGAGDNTAGTKLAQLGGNVVIRHCVAAQLGPTKVEQLIACAMILDGAHVKIRVPIDPAAGGIGFTNSIVRYLREVANRTGLPLPPIVSKAPRSVQHGTLSAKAARARDFQSFATPPGEGIPGGARIVTATWSPAISDRINAEADRLDAMNPRGPKAPRYADRLAEWPELGEIAKLAELFAETWWPPYLSEFQAFTGADGGRDDRVDSTVDAYDELTGEPEGHTSISIPRPPGW